MDILRFYIYDEAKDVFPDVAKELTKKLELV